MGNIYDIFYEKYSSCIVILICISAYSVYSEKLTGSLSNWMGYVWFYFIILFS